MKSEREDGELMTPGDSVAAHYFAELEREGYIRRVDWTVPDKNGQVWPVYEEIDIVQECLDLWERNGLVVRTGEFRNGKPVYVGARFAPPKPV